MSRELLKLAPTEWLLYSPDGRLWKGSPEDLMRVLAPHHPLLSTTDTNQFGHRYAQQTDR